jgi:hypothetical protein
MHLNRNRMRGDVDWINLAQDRDKWQAVLNTVMFYTMWGIWLAEFPRKNSAAWNYIVS